MPFLPFPEYRPDVDDFMGQHTQVLSGVLPRGDGWGPMPALQAYSSALALACRGFFYARKTDGTIVVFGASRNRIFKLDNTTLGWVPVSRATALTAISNQSPAVFTKNAHGLANGDPLVLSTSGSLPTGLTVGAVYYVINATTNTFNVATSPGGSAVNTSSAGSGTHSMTYFYIDVPSTDQWQFAQFGNFVVAVQANETPQVFDISSASAFSDLGGSPPQARYVAVVGRFLVLSGLTSTPRRVHWSDLDGVTTWSAGSGFANFIDLPDGGVVRGVAGGEFGIILQESTSRRMTYVTGQKPAFQIERISEELGLLGPYSIARAGGRVLFFSQQGFQEYRPGVGLVPIGKERVDRTFLADLDTASLQLFIGAADPSGTRVFWAYKSIAGGSSSAFDKVICYDTVLERWSPPIPVSGEYLAPLVKPGLTLDALDTISTDLDALAFTLDTVQAALSARLAAFDTAHQLGFFDGQNLEAVLETPEQGVEGRRVLVRGFAVRTDAAAVQGSVRHRANAQAALAQTPESAINGQGVCPQRIDTRLARARVRIPAGTLWTSCMGIEPDFVTTGEQ